MTETEQKENRDKMQECIAGMVRYGYNTACEEFMEYLEWVQKTNSLSVDILSAKSFLGMCKEKLGLMTEKKRLLDWDKLQQEMGM